MAFQEKGCLSSSDIVNNEQSSEDMPIIVCAWSLAGSLQDSLSRDEEEWDPELYNIPVQEDCESIQEEESVEEIDNILVQDDGKSSQREEPTEAIDGIALQDNSTSPTKCKNRGPSSDLLRLKRPISTPIRHSFDPIRIHKLRRSFKERATWIQNDSEFIPDATPDDMNKNSVSNVKAENIDDQVVVKNLGSEEDIDDEVVGKKRKKLESEEDIDDEVVGRKRKNLGSTIRRKRKRILRGAIRYYARYANSDSE